MIISERRDINILIHNLLKLKKGKIKLLKIVTKGERGGKDRNWILTISFAALNLDPSK